MKLHTLPREKGTGKARKRVGRGYASGTGQTSGRGHKGGKARSGYTPSPIAAGIPFYRRLPKHGFQRQRFAVREGQVNLRDLARCGDVDRIDRQLLIEKKLLDPEVRRFKVLGNGELGRACHVVAERFSASAKAKILAAGGRVTELTPRPKEAAASSPKTARSSHKEGKAAGKPQAESSEEASGEEKKEASGKKATAGKASPKGNRAERASAVSVKAAGRADVSSEKPAAEEGEGAPEEAERSAGEMAASAERTEG